MVVPPPPITERMRWFVLSIVMSSLFPGARAHASAWSLAPGEFYSEVRGGWCTADTYHNPNGDRNFLHGGGLWEQRSLTSHSEFGWKPRLNFILSVPVVSVSRTLDPDRRDLFTQTGLGDAQIGFRYKFFSGPSAAALQIDWKAPLSYERSQRLTHADSVAAGDASGDGDSLDANAARQLGSPVLGDGQQDVTFSLLYGGPLTKKGFFEVSGGYKYRFEKPEDQIVLAADVAYWVTSRLLLAGRYRGEMAGNGVRPTDEPDEHRLGPWLVYRIDDR